MSERTEIQLIEMATGGDIECFGEICSRYYAAMVAIAYCILSDHQLAEDAVQESFARALVNLRNLKNKSRFVPWLAAICRNVAKDMVAVRARRIKTEDISNTDQDSTDSENIEAIRRAIEKLPAPARELIVLRYYNNLSYDKIGSVLGISRATINGRISRAKGKMADYLRRNGFPENRI